MKRAACSRPRKVQWSTKKSAVVDVDQTAFFPVDFNHCTFHLVGVSRSKNLVDVDKQQWLTLVDAVNAVFVHFYCTFHHAQ